MPTPSLIYTIGHSTHSVDEFIKLLTANNVTRVADIRTVPKSRHNPQFWGDALSESLSEENIEYRHFADLGGLRHRRADSPNGGWRNASFQGYADYMLTDEFKGGLEELLAWQGSGQTVLMCAEAVPWRCHRSMVGDALIVRGVEVEDIFPNGTVRPEKLTAFAVVEGTEITYPPEG